jgi:hypothetical protein
LQTRFRYHSPQSKDPFDDHDRKSRADFRIDGRTKTEEQIVKDVDLIANVVAARFGVQPEFVEVRGDHERAMFRLAMQPWAHLKLEKRSTPPPS